MEKINLFIIVAFKEQTYKHVSMLNNLTSFYNNKQMVMDTTNSMHYFMLSKYFNLYNFYEYENEITAFDNPMIYHLPYGKDSIDTKVEEKLLKFKGKVPIIMRSYDAHSPLKTSKEYMLQYHDLILTYLSKHVNNDNILFTNMCFDNNLVYQYNKLPQKRKLACMILRKESRKDYDISSVEFKKNNLELTKIYKIREEIVDFDQIDIYGRGWSYRKSNYKGPLYPHMKKYQKLYEYKFNIIIENAIVDNFLSEKIFDSFISLSIPVYLGTPVISDWIPKSCYVDINDFDTKRELIEFLENMREEEYLSYINSIIKYRNELFEKFSTKNNFVIPIYRWYNKNINNRVNYEEKYLSNIEKEVNNLTFIEQNDLGVHIRNLIIKFKVLSNFFLRKIFND